MGGQQGGGAAVRGEEYDVFQRWGSASMLRGAAGEGLSSGQWLSAITSGLGPWI